MGVVKNKQTVLEKMQDRKDEGNSCRRVWISRLSFQLELFEGSKGEAGLNRRERHEAVGGDGTSESVPAGGTPLPSSPRRWSQI